VARLFDVVEAVGLLACVDVVVDEDADHEDLAPLVVDHEVLELLPELSRTSVTLSHQRGASVARLRAAHTAR